MNKYNQMYVYNNIPTEKDNVYQINSQKGFIRGNLFDNLYQPYKNYEPINLNLTSEKKALLQKVMQYNFAMIDLNLYLDNYPTDQEVLKIFLQYRDMALKATKEYEQKYGPLTIYDEPSNVNQFIYAITKWPWEVEE